MVRRLFYHAAHFLAGGLAATGGLSRLERAGEAEPDTLRVLTYHRVNYPESTPWLDPRLVSATPDAFAEQMEYVARQYSVVSMPQVLAACERRGALPPRSTLITFDDAYCDFAERAWPVLRQLKLPVTLFVPTAYPGHPESAFWWDRLYQAVSATPEVALRLDGSLSRSLPLRTPAERGSALRLLRDFLKSIDHRRAISLVETICGALGGDRTVRKTVLDWDELRALAHEGVTLGAHSQTHPLLTRVPPGDMRREVSGSYADLRREAGEVLPVFAYPGGGLDAAVRRVVRQAGFRAAFVTRGGLNHLRRADPLRLRRMNITQKTDLPIYRLRLLNPLAALTRGLYA